MFPPLPTKKYQIIYSDPSWNYKGQKQHTGKGGDDSGGAEVHYPTVTLDDLKKLDIPSISDKDCLLFMWTSSPHLDQAIDLMKAWGFKYVTVGFVWYKGKPNPGYYTMSECELCIIGKRGKIPTPRGARNVRQFLAKLRTKHSEKPREIAARIVEMFPTQNRIEMFSRIKDPEWDVWGNEV